MKYMPLLFSFLMIVSCNEERRIDTRENKFQEVSGQAIPKPILKSNYEPGASKVEENLFGRFFCDRAAFYVIENPTHGAHFENTKSITLYYLDGELGQTKYVLAEDISTLLLKSLGNFKITGLDNKNRNILHSQQILIKSSKGVKLNDQLDNYELRWTLADKEIKYRVNLNAVKEKFAYRETSSSYEREFKRIETSCL